MGGVEAYNEINLNWPQRILEGPVETLYPVTPLLYQARRWSTLSSSSPPIPLANMAFNTHTLFANIKTDLCGALLEFVGTFFFLTVAFGGAQATTVAGSVGQPAPNALNVFIISFSFGFGLLVSAWLFYRVTGALFNPNVSLALFLTGVIGPVRFVLYCIAQLAGSIAAAGVILGLSPGPVSYG